MSDHLPLSVDQFLQGIHFYQVMSLLLFFNYTLMITRYLSLMLCMLSWSAQAQFKEDFSGNFTSPHHWDGLTGYFKINAAAQLQSKGPTKSSKIFLQTYSNALANASWTFWMKMNFESSVSNYTKVFLASSSSDLSDTQLEGYFLKIGGLSGSKDAIDLYYQKGSTQTLVVKGIEGHAAGKSVTLRIKVERDATGKWSVYADITGGNNFQLEGIASHANLFSSQAFGFMCIHSSSRRSDFYFDELSIDGGIEDAEAPHLLSENYESNSNSWLLQFNEALDSLSIPVLTTIDDTPLALAIQWISSTSFRVKDTMTIVKDGTALDGWLSGIKDLSGNAGIVPFFFIKPKAAKTGDVVINEVLFNPFSYGQDFVELYNSSYFYIELANATMKNQDGDTMVLKPHLMAPGSYCVYTKDSNAVTEFYSRAARNTFVDCNLHALPDDEGILTLSDSEKILIDQLSYTHTMHNPLLENQEGVSLERVNVAIASDWRPNWQSASTASEGATPGYANSQAGSLVQGGLLSIEPHSISPGTDGYRNYATIDYTLPKAGGSVRMDVFSLQGIWICSLEPSGPSDVQGMCTWNGTNTNLQPVSTGLYLIVAEFFHPDGDHVKIKGTISVLLR
ncbi:MAG TPA: lamin tail domain-containing protein [Cytophagaceae bacterium]|nr:lamin tail domain-containing protein [Cytophagaceae bacterium]